MHLRSRSKFTSHFLPHFLTLALGLMQAGLQTSQATGNFSVLYLLEDPAHAAISSPEFWFELEMKDLAKSYAVPEKYIPTLAEIEQSIPEETKPQAEPKPTPTLDTPEGKLYTAGATAYLAKDYPTAQKAWQDLLAMPEAERKVRTVWAEYMLGRMAIANNQPDQAPTHFQAARKLAAAGFEDAQGLASASYGWEAYVHKKSNLAKAAELYLKQLATGDHHALVSLRQILPGEVPPEDPDEFKSSDHSEWAKFVNDPVLRQVMTRWYLAYGMDASRYDESHDEETKHWIALIEKAQPSPEEAVRLAWLAYRQADYPLTKRWLKLVPQESALSNWLQAKLALRDGDAAKAEMLMAKVTAEVKPAELKFPTDSSSWNPLPHLAAQADEAVVLLSRDKFPEALAKFLKCEHFADAAYVAERVLHLAELKDFVDSNFPQTKPEPDAAGIEPSGFIREILARRMVREDQEAAAKPYFSADLQSILTDYLAALAKAGNDKLPARERALGWWGAAKIVMDHGDGLMGTSVGPDNRMQDGMFSMFPLHRIRRTGEKVEFGEEAAAADSKEKQRFSIPPSAEEKKRLAQHVLAYEFRFHYRWVAVALAKKAAALLPNGTEEKADVLNTAGTLMFNRDVKREEEFFFAIKETCPNTVIGKQVLAAKHTLPLDGPLSGVKPKE